jgi:hypothetical protein
VKRRSNFAGHIILGATVLSDFAVSGSIVSLTDILWFIR